MPALQSYNSPNLRKCSVSYLFLQFSAMLFACAAVAVAQPREYKSWQSHLCDSILLSSLSIPGAHDAATGEGLCFVAGFGKTQSLTLSELWDSGVRAFDLRPAVSDGALKICHGPIKVRISFDDALEVICSKLKQNPTEFAIVLLREESESENDEERALWPSAVGACIASLGDRAAAFSSGMTVGDVRGKILFLSRSHYCGTAKGALIKGWSHSAQGSCEARIVSSAGGAEEVLQVQDYYNTIGHERQCNKSAAIKHFFNIAANAPACVWTINFLSGYSTLWLGIPGVPTTAGYKRNAERQNAYALNCLNEQQKPAVGIVFMDFAGIDAVAGGIWHPAAFRVHGKTLVQTVIERNFAGAGQR